MKRMKLCIRSKLVLIVLAIVVPLLIVTCFGYIMMFQSNRNELSWKIRLVAEEIARELGEHFDKTFSVIDVLATNPSVIKMDPVACDRLFSKLLPSYPLHLNILAARSDGFNVGSAVSPQDAHALNYNDKEWFQQSISGKRVIGNLHVSKLFKSPAIMMASPVYDSNASVRGVIGFPMNLDRLREKIVRDWQLPPKSIVVVADAKGNIRDYALINELICLSNMENINALLINENVSQKDRLIKLNQIAIQQMRILQESERKILK